MSDPAIATIDRCIGIFYYNRRTYIEEGRSVDPFTSKGASIKHM